MHPSLPRPSGASATCPPVVITGLTGSSAREATAADAAASALEQIDDELLRAGLTWQDVRTVTVQIDVDLPGIASWRALTGPLQAPHT